eukprot:CAMPEP_0201623200 /NCGR_PEP_ID=MMETSP0492-20130828/47806_1 /ASSEMBLY_ACC=CAM_ASM_000837 /TAXON_ID=420259 /ORGANISM="Thalassiosira gravida, Strain GMp14c1" /LENGTH=89 /DNA_ID=CAMNT_0048092825 /DNA_START=45 /DNA_END=314 /DNA_ORIENTATION=-
MVRRYQNAVAMKIVPTLPNRGEFANTTDRISRANHAIARGAPPYPGRESSAIAKEPRLKENMAPKKNTRTAREVMRSAPNMGQTSKTSR